MSASAASRYRDMVLAAAPRLLGTLDREALSPTSGSFDRDHWAWQFRDFPITMMQTGVLPLAQLWASEWPGNPYAGSARLHSWLVAALEASLGRQRRNGAWDSVGPFTQDHGVTLAMAYTLATTVRIMGEGALAADLVRRIAAGVRLGCEFAARSAEDYAFISNHRALFALAWLRAAAMLGDHELLRRAEQEVRVILEHQSGEGWYVEYGGADPGYQSLGMSYLAQFQHEHPSDDLDASLRRAVRFMSHFVHPDGSLGGVYGSRLTSLWYPSGFELLSGQDPLACAVSSRVAESFIEAAVVTPDTSDAENLPLLMHSYLIAADAAEERDTAHGRAGEMPSLPCDSLEGVENFDEAGLVVAGTPHYYAVANVRRGGVGVVFSRHTRQLVFEDAGYVVRSAGKTWTSALTEGARREARPDTHRFVVRARFALANRHVLSPASFILLRLLNLTLFRSVRLGAFVRRMIIERLITGRQDGPYRLEREMEFAQDRVTVTDTIRGPAEPVEAVVRARAFTPFHMGSTRYFHGRELIDAGDVPLSEVAGALSSSGRAERRIEVAFDQSGCVALREKDGAF